MISRSCYLLLLPVVLAACSSGEPARAPTAAPPGVGTVTLQHSAITPAPEQLLDIGVLVFANGATASDADRFGEWVYDEVRDNERHLLPFTLRNKLLESNQWGAVRVLPQSDPSVDLLVSGAILASDGTGLVLQIHAEDSTGRVWLDRTYRDSTNEDDYPQVRELRRSSSAEAQLMEEPFADIYAQIANDLLNARNELSGSQLQEIQQVSLLVYANDLSPESFAYMLAEDESGRLTATSLPATNDPMMARVMDMRRRHYLFIDTVDEYYEALHEEMQSPYLIWRRYSFDQELEEQRALERAQGQGKYSSSSGYLTLTQRYDRYRWSKIYEQEFRELASSFNREAAPAILELNQQVRGLNGTLEEQYIQWRRILRELFRLETGELTSGATRD